MEKNPKNYQLRTRELVGSRGLRHLGIFLRLWEILESSLPISVSKIAVNVEIIVILAKERIGVVFQKW